MSEPTEHPHPRLLLPIPFGPLVSPAGRLLWSDDLWVAGWSLLETTGTASAQLSVYDGHDDGGVPVAQVPLSAGQGTRDFFGGHYLSIKVGLFVIADSGSVSGTLYLADR